MNKRGGVTFVNKHEGVIFGMKFHFDTTTLVIASAPKESAEACTLNNYNEKLLLVYLYNPHRTVLISSKQMKGSI